MSVFICSECGARFEGDLREASDGAFRHTAEHADPEAPGAVTKSPLPSFPQAIDSAGRESAGRSVHERNLL